MATHVMLINMLNVGFGFFGGAGCFVAEMKQNYFFFKVSHSLLYLSLLNCNIPKLLF